MPEEPESVYQLVREDYRERTLYGKLVMGLDWAPLVFFLIIYSPLIIAYWIAKRLPTPPLSLPEVYKNND